MSQKQISLYLFENNEPAGRSALTYKLDYIKDKGSPAEYRIESEEIILIDERIRIVSSISTDNMAYSFMVSVDNSYSFSFLGFKQSWDTSDPCILFSTPAGIEMQVSITLDVDNGLG